MSGFTGIPFGAFIPLYRLISADFNTTADQPMVKLHNYAAFTFHNIYVTNTTIALSTAVGGFYTGAGKTGLILVAATQAYSGADADNTGTVPALTAVSRGRRTESPIFALSTAQGAVATADIYVFGFGVL